MSSGCALLGTQAQVGRNVPVNRSQTGVRTKRRFNVNLQDVSLQSDALGKRVSLRLAVKTIRSVEHNGGLDKFLLGTKNAKLTLAGKRLKKQVTKALTEQGKLPAPKKSAPKATKAPSANKIAKDASNAASKKASAVKTAAKKPAAKKA